jgi:hypothetical protein
MNPNPGVRSLEAAEPDHRLSRLPELDHFSEPGFLAGIARRQSRNSAQALALLRGSFELGCGGAPPDPAAVPRRCTLSGRQTISGGGLTTRESIGATTTCPPVSEPSAAEVT